MRQVRLRDDQGAGAQAVLRGRPARQAPDGGPHPVCQGPSATKSPGKATSPSTEASAPKVPGSIQPRICSSPSGPKLRMRMRLRATTKALLARSPVHSSVCPLRQRRLTAMPSKASLASGGSCRRLFARGEAHGVDAMASMCGSSDASRAAVCRGPVGGGYGFK